uniref:Uncharacterized protein n=1 Tax=Rhizophagus irregularis (strain DAOM 181602 / DAOM 197198 / MUCL 43194) TaxID=747089 RepID=U9SPA9_RHIID
MKSALSRRNKKVMFIEDVLDIDGVNMKKWKHMCIELGVSTKELEGKLIDNTNENTRKIKKEYMGKFERSNININYFDESEKQGKNTIISWNEEGEFPVFAVDKKGSKKDTLDWNNSPLLIMCEGCEKNIKNKNSRIITTRKEEGVIKPYETISTLIKKNECIRAISEDEENNEEINRKIDQIDSLFENENDRRAKRYYLMIELKKIKSHTNSKENNVNKEEEILMSASYEIFNENEFKILIRITVR